MGANDSVTNAQAEAGALGCLFGGVKRIKDAFGVGDSSSVVGNGDLDVLFAAAGVNNNAPPLSRVLNRVVGVVQYIQEDLLQLLCVA